MSKYNRNPKARQARIWFENVGDGAKKSIEKENPNDVKIKKGK
jgi:hypothetical protein